MTIESRQVEEKNILSRKAFFLNILWLVWGGVGLGAAVFLGESDQSSVSVMHNFLLDGRAWMILVLGTVLWVAAQYCLRNKRYSWARILAVGEVSVVVLGWLWLQYPYIFTYSDGTGLSLIESAAPPATLLSLAWALVIGSVLIFPALYYLFRVFKWEGK